MEGQTLIGMSDAEFDNLIERYLRRGEQEPRELETGAFFDATWWCRATKSARLGSHL